MNKSEVWPGEPVRASVTPHNFSHRTLAYDWTTNGGKVEGTGDTVTINTTGVADGQPYSVSVHVTDPHNRKAISSCQTAFSTKKRLPPVTGCAANPTSAIQGEPIAIHADASSPQGGLVTLAVTSDCGVSGLGADVTVDTANLMPGICRVTCTVTDDHQLIASGSTWFEVRKKVKNVPSMPGNITFHSVYFATGLPTPAEPDKGLVSSQKERLDQIAETFNGYIVKEPGAKLIVEAHTDSVEGHGNSGSRRLSKRRVAIVEKYLISKGVPAISLQGKPLGISNQLSAAEVEADLDKNPEFNQLTSREQAVLLRGIVPASNRRVDFYLITPDPNTTQTLVHDFPFGPPLPAISGGNEGAQITCSTDPPNVIAGSRVVTHCAVEGLMRRRVRVEHVFRNITSLNADLSIDTSGLAPDTYTVTSLITVGDELPRPFESKFTVQMGQSDCQGLIVFMYPSVDLRTVERPESEFTGIVGYFRKDLSQDESSMVKSGICEQPECDRLLKRVCAETTPTHPADDIHGRIWPFTRNLPFILPDVDGLDNLDPSNKVVPLRNIQPTRLEQWKWTGNVKDESSGDVIHFALGAASTNNRDGLSTLLPSQEIKLDVRRGMMSGVRSSLNKINNLYAKLIAILGIVGGWFRFILKRFVKKRKAAVPEPRKWETP